MADSGEGAVVRPVVVVSECLGFAAVRYNGQILKSRFVEALRDHVEFVSVCPEMEIGLGVPRDPIRLVQLQDERRLVQPSTDRDLTEEMTGFGHDFLDGRRGVEGFILKSRSPSCGITDAKVMSGADEGSPPLGSGPGMFAEIVQKERPWAAMEDEGRLTNLRIRHHFLAKLWALARLRAAETSGRMAELVRFQTEHKLLMMAYDQEGVRELERKEREHFLGMITEFRDGRLPLPALLTVLQSWTVRFGQEYLDAQRLFEPYPRKLFDLDSSGSGRLV